MGKSEACGVYRAENPFFLFVCSCGQESGAKRSAAVGKDAAAGRRPNWMYSFSKWWQKHWECLHFFIMYMHRYIIHLPFYYSVHLQRNESTDFCRHPSVLLRLVAFESTVTILTLRRGPFQENTYIFHLILQLLCAAVHISPSVWMDPSDFLLLCLLINGGIKHVMFLVTSARRLDCSDFIPKVCLIHLANPQ